ncbi:hypothetical protein ACIQH6_03845 [Micromonospora orduensis]|uniref:hypothetical protein n=1 Tax=Micromonospora orduensis TaxID=1420891 RepID=UPI0038040BD3
MSSADVLVAPAHGLARGRTGGEDEVAVVERATGGTVDDDGIGSPFAGLRNRFSDCDDSAIRVLRIAP